jgi:PAS domain S-box-containing protein
MNPEFPQDSVRASDDQFRLLADHITDAFWIRSADMREVQYISPAFERIWGRSVASLYAAPHRWIDFVVPDDRELVKGAFASLLGDVASLDIEYRIARPDGEIRWVRVRAFQVRDAAGTLMRQTGIVTDITDRRRAEQALETSVAELRALAEAVPQMVWIASPERASIYINQRWTNYTGLTLEHSLGFGWLTPFHPEDQERARLAWDQATATTSTYSVECRLRHKDGHYRWWLIRSEPQRGTGGKVLKWFGTCTDIHDLKLAELGTARLNRALTMVSSCNETLVRAQDEQQVLDQICKLALERGGYRRAWVGYAQDDPARSIKVLAHAGADDGYVSEIEETWDASDPLAMGPGGRICLPLGSPPGAFGVLTLYSEEDIQPSEEEVRLLQGLANSVAFAIESLRGQVERRRLQVALTKVAVGVSRAAGAEFFQQLVRSMAQALGAKAGFISLVRPGETATARTIAAIVDGEIIANYEYALAGTPCERLLTSDVCVIEGDATDRLSPVPAMAALGARGYVGRRICSSSGELFGHVFVLFEESVKDPEFITSMLQIFGARAASELERRRADAHVQEQAAMLDVAHDAIQVRDLLGRITYWNKGCERTYGWTAAEMIGHRAGGMLPCLDQLRMALISLQAKGEW